MVIKATFVDFHRRCSHCDEINALLVQKASIAAGQYRAEGKVAKLGRRGKFHRRSKRYYFSRAVSFAKVRFATQLVRRSFRLPMSLRVRVQRIEAMEKLSD